LKTISVFEAKTHLSQVLEELSSGNVEGYVITRHGKPIARLTPEPSAKPLARIGIAKHRFVVPDSIDERADEAAALFAGR
jgi:prevent-host-death family protein